MTAQETSMWPNYNLSCSCRAILKVLLKTFKLLELVRVVSLLDFHRVVVLLDRVREVFQLLELLGLLEQLDYSTARRS